MTKTKAPMMAVIHPLILKLDIIPAANLKTIAFTTNVKRPKVKIFIGNVNNKSIGRSIAFNNPIIRLAIKADLKSLISNPFTNLDVTSKATADKTQTRRI